MPPPDLSDAVFQAVVTQQMGNLITTIGDEGQKTRGSYTGAVTITTWDGTGAQPNNAGGGNDPASLGTISKEQVETWQAIDGVTLQMIKSSADYSEGLKAIAEAQSNCCEIRKELHEADRADYISFRDDTLYDGFPVEILDADGNVIGTYGPISAQIANEATNIANWRAIQDGYLELAQNHQTNVELPYWIQMIAGLIATIQGILLYNEFMGILNDIMENNQLTVDAASNGYTGTLFPAAMAASQQWVADNPARIAALDTVNAHIHEYGDTTWTHWDGTWRAAEAATLPEILQLALDLTGMMRDTATAMQTAAADADATYAAAYGGESELAPELLTAAQCAVTRVCELRDWMQANAEKIEGFWDGAFMGNTTTVATATTTGTTDGVASAKAAIDALAVTGGKRDAYFDGNYAGPEGALAAQAIADGAASSANLITDHAASIAHADERLAYYNSTYAGGETAVAQAVLAEAATMVDRLSEEYDWFKQVGDEMQAFFDATYKGPESTTSPILINRAAEMSQTSKEIIGWVSDLAEELKDYWDSVYRAAEASTAPVIINNGADGSDALEEEYKWFSDRAHDLWNRWDQNFYPCDIKDLEFHCAMWDKHDMLEEIHDDKDLARTMADAVHDAYVDKGLACEIGRLDEICAMTPYEPQYCDVEGKAVLHVRQQTDRAKEEAQRCSTRYCCGATEHQINELNIQGARVETAALQAAHRFEQWWYVQEENRRHRYHQNIFEVAERWPQTQDRSLNTSVSANDHILTHIHNRIVRGYEYLTNMQNAERTAVQGMSDAVRYSIETIRVGHFFPEQAGRFKIEADHDALQHVNDGLRAIELGHFFPEIAMRMHQLAEKTSDDASKLGLDAIRLGQFHPELNQRLLATAVQDATSSLNGAVGLVETGHDHFVQAGKDWDNSGRISDAAVGRGNETMRIGPTYAQLAAEKGRIAMVGSLDMAKIGVDTMRTGHFWPELAHNYRNNLMAHGQSSLSNAVNAMRIGQGYNEMAFRWHSAAASSFHNAINDAFNHLYNMTNSAASTVVQGASAGTAGALGGLQEANSAVGNGLATFGDAYAQLFGSSGSSGSSAAVVGAPPSASAVTHTVGAIGNQSYGGTSTYNYGTSTGGTSISGVPSYLGGFY